jgi:integrase
MSVPKPLLQRLPLQDLALTPASTRAYTTSLSNFLAHSRLTPQQLFTLPALRLDRLLAEFIQYSYERSTPYTYASHTLHAVIFYRPDLKHSMFVSRQCLRGWERVKRTTSHPPLTWELTVVIACSMARSGFHGPAVAVLLAFDCYLRVGELTRLRRCDIVMPDDARMGGAHTGMAVCLSRTKTGLNQSVALQSHAVAAILQQWVQRHTRDARSTSTALLFPFSPQWFGRLLRSACAALGLGPTPYVPHSLRHGGATADFLRTGSVEHVAFRGRWKSLESVRTYVQTARALLAAQQVPPSLNQLGVQLSASLEAVLSYSFHTVSEVRPRRSVTFRL